VRSRLRVTAEPAANDTPDGDAEGSSRCVLATRVARTAKNPPESLKANDSFKPVIVNAEAGLRLLDLLEKLSDEQLARERAALETSPALATAAHRMSGATTQSLQVLRGKPKSSRREK